VADPLTGLRTRLFLLDKLEMAIGRMREQADVLFAVLFLDLDRFKVVNDSLGHLAGDKLLVSIAQRLLGSIGLTGLDTSQVTIARIGGDEFTVLLERISSAEQAEAFAESINRQMKMAFNLDGHQVFASLSIGVAMGSETTTAEDILRDADTAMYQAKSHGRERYEVFNSAMRTKAVERLALETELRQAIRSHSLEVYYQPKISLATGKISEFEALVRWQHPERGMIKPHEFVPLAEETGLIIPLGAWVLETACRQLAQWHSDFPASDHVGISVNLSTRQFAQKDLLHYIAGVLATSGLPARCLSFELTESILMGNPEDAIAILKAVRAMHIGLKIDDFGTGFSSLGYLHRLPFNELKIDRSFVEGLGKQRESQQIVRTIILLARSLRMAVVAEGVESTSQLQQLASLGCNFVQGDLLSPPLRVSEASQFLARNLLFVPTALSGFTQDELVAIYR
jgi:diguanylate cyclase (GGDEF)-like protein